MEEEDTREEMAVAIEKQYKQKETTVKELKDN